MSFEDTPLGAASLAQVHKAVLQDGRTVAVKIQHPKVQAQSSKDILLMEVKIPVDPDLKSNCHIHPWCKQLRQHHPVALEAPQR